MIAQITSGSSGIRPVKFTTKQISQDIYRLWSIKGKFSSFWMKQFATFQPPFPSSHQHTAALFAFIKHHHKSRVSPFGGWCSASFTDIRVCLCGWVMDLLCWYVLLWWLQRPIQWLGSFLWTVAQSLLCSKETFKRWFFTQQTRWSPQ